MENMFPFAFCWTKHSMGSLFLSLRRKSVNYPIIAKLLNISLYRPAFPFKNNAFFSCMLSLSVRNLYYSLIVIFKKSSKVPGVGHPGGGSNY